VIVPLGASGQMGEISLSRGLKKIFVTQNLFTPSQIHRTDFYTVLFVERQFQNTAFTEEKKLQSFRFPQFYLQNDHSWGTNRHFQA